MGWVRAFAILMMSCGLFACATVKTELVHSVCTGPTCTTAQLEAAVPRKTTYLNEFGWDASTTPPASPQAPYKTVLDYQQAWLETGEDGFLFEAHQVEAIRHWIKTQKAAGRPVLVSIYIHGWNGNAVEGVGGQVDEFYAYTSRVTDSVRRLHDAGRLPKTPAVLGVWASWPGKDVPDFALFQKIKSFQSRARAATRIGQARGVSPTGQPSLHEALRQISDEVRQDPDNRMLVSGLSFGGRVLAHLFLDPGLGDTDIRPLGPHDLIVTLNAAIGADCFDKAIAANQGPPGPVKAPYWINLSSRDDAARSVWYPAGASLKLHEDSCDAGSDHQFTAIGFDTAQLTHELTVPTNSSDPPSPAPLSAPAFAAAYEDAAWSTQPPHNIPLRFHSFKGPGPGGVGQYRAQADRYSLHFSRWPGATGQSGLWTVATDETMIQDPKHPNGLNSHHSFVFETILTRLWVDALYDPAR